MKCPTKVFKLLLSKPVTVASRVARMIRGSIALDGKNETPWLPWMGCRVTIGVNPQLAVAISIQPLLRPFAL